MKYELRILSHLVSRQVSMISVDMAMEDSQWQSVYTEVQQIVVMWRLSDIDDSIGDSSGSEHWILQYP